MKIIIFIIFILASTVLADSLEQNLEKANKYTVKILNSIDIPFIGAPHIYLDETEVGLENIITPTGETCVGRTNQAIINWFKGVNNGRQHLKVISINPPQIRISDIIRFRDIVNMLKDRYYLNSTNRPYLVRGARQQHQPNRYNLRPSVNRFYPF